MNVCIYVYMYVCMYICTNCMYVCMYECMCVCMYPPISTNIPALYLSLAPCLIISSSYVSVSSSLHLCSCDRVDCESERGRKEMFSLTTHSTWIRKP